MRSAGCIAAALLTATGDFAADCSTVNRVEAYATSGTPPENAVCSTYLTTGAKTGVSCHWPFPLRDPAANEFAAQLWQEITTCRAGTALGPDAQVNHPDSYDLREWSGPLGIHALSVKDKGGLGQTFVFFRHEPK